MAYIDFIRGSRKREDMMKLMSYFQRLQAKIGTLMARFLYNEKKKNITKKKRNNEKDVIIHSNIQLTFKLHKKQAFPRSTPKITFIDLE